jgi:hypothetical protein
MPAIGVPSLFMRNSAKTLGFSHECPLNKGLRPGSARLRQDAPRNSRRDPIKLEAKPMTTFLRYASLILLGFATLAVVMMMIVVAAEAKDKTSNSDTPADAKLFVAPRSDRSDVAETSGDSNKGGGDSVGRPRQIIVEDAPKPLPSKKIEVAKGEEITLPASKSLPAAKLLASEAAEDAETETPPAVPAPQAEAPIEPVPAPKLTSDSYHTAYRHSFYGHAYGYGYNDDDYDGCE